VTLTRVSTLPRGNNNATCHTRNMPRGKKKLKRWKKSKDWHVARY